MSSSYLEKLPLQTESSVQSRRQGLASLRKVLVFVCSFWLTVTLLRAAWEMVNSPMGQDPVHRVTASFEWKKVDPSKSLEYHDCFDGFQCARLEVPVDWNRTSDDGGDNMAIAIIKKPAKVDVTDPRYGGAIFLNPGGPGGSGVNFMFRYGEKIQTVVDGQTKLDANGKRILSAEDKYFDIISFDPRGVNNTTPGFSCFSDPMTRQAWELQGSAIGHSIEHSEATFEHIFARNEALATSCSSLHTSIPEMRVNGNEHLGQYISTASVVQDMVQMIEKHGEWREKRANEIISGSRKIKGVEDIRSRTSWKEGREKLQYWGFSYGTYLGETFASMHPHRVERVVLDGVVEPYAYYSWDAANDIKDVGEIVEYLITSCYEAGPLKCALYSASGPNAISKHMEQILADLRARPLAASTDKGPIAVTHSQIITHMYSAMYKPLSSFEPLAQLLFDLSNGNATSFAALQGSPSCPTHPDAFEGGSASQGIQCADGDDLRSRPRSWFQAKIADMRSTNPMFGDMFGSWFLPCARYSVRAKWRFTGPFGGITAHPILFASQSFDPICPLLEAHQASKLFPGSEVLETEGYGHCTLAMPSVCGAKIVRRYFQTGELPVGGAKCKTDAGPFGLGEASVLAEDRELLEVLKAIAGSWWE